MIYSIFITSYVTRQCAFLSRKQNNRKKFPSLLFIYKSKNICTTSSVSWISYSAVKFYKYDNGESRDLSCRSKFRGPTRNRIETTQQFSNRPLQPAKTIEWASFSNRPLQPAKTIEWASFSANKIYLRILFAASASLQIKYAF